MVAAVVKPAKASAVLAALFEIRNVEAAMQADAELESVTRVVLQAWGMLMAAAGTRTPGAAEAKARSVLQQLERQLEAAVADSLGRCATKSYETAFQCWVDGLPKQYWKHAFPDDPDIVLFEAEDDDANDFLLQRRALKTPAKPRLPKQTPSKKTIAKAKQPPSRSEVRSIVNQGGYKRRLKRWSRKISDRDLVAQKIADGVAKGKTQEQIARSIQPHVQSLASSARRIVRTEAARINNLMAERTYEQFDEIIRGFQIVAILDAVTRPHHAARHGTIFWKKGRPNAANRPSLPDEPNCRCTYAPVLDDLSNAELVGGPAIDTRTYSGWFQRQPEAVKKKVVGTARWNAVKDKGGRPAWTDFLDPKTGRLADVDDLESATRRQIERKRDRLNRKLQKRRRVAKKATR